MRTPHPLRALRGGRTAADLAARRLLASPRASLATAGFAAACVILAATDGFGPSRPLGLAGMLALGVAVAGSPGPERLRASALVELNGASPRFRRLLAVAEVAWLAAAGLLVGGLVAIGVAAATGDALRRWPTIVGCGLLAMAGALVGSRAQLAGTLAPPVARPARRRAATGARLLLGSALLAGGALLPSMATDWISLDTLLPTGLVLVALGLALAAPVVVRVAGGVVGRVGRTPAMRAAGNLVAERSAVLGPTAVLLSFAAVLVTVQGVLGLGLAEREGRRQDAIAARTAPAGMSAEQLIVQPTPDLGDPTWSWDEAQLAFVGAVLGHRTSVIDDADVREVAAAAPRATTVPVRTLVTTTVVQEAGVNQDEIVLRDQVLFADREEPGRPHGDVAVATPELLDALGLRDRQADVDAGRWLLLDPDVPLRDGGVRLDGAGPYPAVLVPVADRGALALPAVLGPPSAFDATSGPVGPSSSTALQTTGVVLGFPSRPTDAEVRAVADAFPRGIVIRGDDRVAPDYGGRLDDAGSVAVHSTRDLWSWVLVGLGAGLVLLLVGLRFLGQARRAEDDLLEVVGAPPTFLRRLAAVEATVVTAVSVALGSAVAAGGLAFGISTYNRIGVFDDGQELPPVPAVIPATLVVTLMVLPLVAAAGAWVVAGRRPPVDPAGLADRLAF